jgi:hypothetical protein
MENMVCVGFYASFDFRDISTHTLVWKEDDD